MFFKHGSGTSVQFEALEVSLNLHPCHHNKKRK